MTDIPCVLVSGYLGAGKTSLINAFLKNPNGQRATVLVNDFGKINIDAALIENLDGETLSLTNGCACCSIGDSLIETANSVVNATLKPDLIIVEASGVANPARLSLLLLGVTGLAPAKIVTVIDASQAFAASKDKYIASLFRDQITSATALIVNRHENQKDQDFLETYLQNTGFKGSKCNNLHEALALTQDAAKTQRLGSKNEEHDFASVLVSAPHTLDLVQLENWLNELPPFIHRVKGYVRASKLQFDPAIYVVNKTRQENSIENIKTPIEPSLIGQLVLIGPRDRLLKSQIRFA